MRPSLYLMISAMGVAIALQNLLYATIGAKLYALPQVFAQDSLQVGSAVISKMDLFAFGFSVIAIAILNFILTRTKVGTAIRAASYDMEMVSVLGVNLDVLVAVLFLIAGALGGMAGVFMGVKYMVYPSMGWITNKAYIGAVIGGLGSLPGAIVGGILLGLIEALVSVANIGPVHLSLYRDVFSFGILIAPADLPPHRPVWPGSRRETLAMEYAQAIFTNAAIYAIATVGLAIFTGYTGLFSLGHAAFMALGAYTTAILTYFLHWPFIPALLVGMVVAVLASIIIGYPDLARQAALRLFRHRHPGFR